MPTTIDAEVVTPTLSPDQKLAVLTLQRRILSAQVQINTINKELEKMGPDMNTLLTNIAKELSIDPNLYTFDLENLALVPRKES